MLFPSMAEGYGLPPVEALLGGARVLCNNLPVLQEILGQSAVYASVTAPDLWKNTILRWARDPGGAPGTGGFAGPNWDDHFKTVLRLR